MKCEISYLLMVSGKWHTVLTMLPYVGTRTKSELIYSTILFLNVYHKMFIKEFISSLRQYTYNFILVMKTF